MKKKIDIGQLNIFDLLDEIQKRQSQALPPVPVKGKASIDAAMRAIISESLKRSPLSRYDVAARMSNVLGVSISKEQIDAWSAESKKQHRFPVVYLHAFCEATGDYSLIRHVAELCGGYYIEGEEAIDLAVGRATSQIKELQKRVKALNELRKK